MCHQWKRLQFTFLDSLFKILLLTAIVSVLFQMSLGWSCVAHLSMMMYATSFEFSVTHVFVYICFSKTFWTCWQMLSKVVIRSLLRSRHSATWNFEAWWEVLRDGCYPLLFLLHRSPNIENFACNLIRQDIIPHPFPHSYFCPRVQFNGFFSLLSSVWSWWLWGVSKCCSSNRSSLQRNRRNV